MKNDSDRRHSGRNQLIIKSVFHNIMIFDINYIKVIYFTNGITLDLFKFCQKTYGLIPPYRRTA